MSVLTGVVRWFVVPLLLAVLAHSDTSLKTGYDEHTGFMLRPQPMYLAVVPRLVRPSQVVSVYLTLFRLTGQAVTVSLTVRRGRLEQAAVTHRFTQPGSKLLQMKMREDAEAGNYSLRLEGRAGDGSAGILFVNESRLAFHSKQVSCFIQTDRAVARANYWVRFRVIAFTPNQLPVRSGSITIYIKDGKGRPVQRLVAKHLFNGVYEDRFKTVHPNQNGWWTIEVHGWGYVYSQKVRVEAHFPELFYANVTMPAYVKEGEYALAGIVSANLTDGRCVKGNATVYLEVKPPGQKKVAIMKEVYAHFNCREAFLFTLEEISKYTPRMEGTELYVTANVLDGFYGWERTWTQKATILGNTVRLAFLGGHVRVFKPSTPFDVHVAVYESDGSRLSRQYRRTVTIDVVTEMNDGPGRVSKPFIAVVPDSSIVSHTFTPHQGAKRITVRAYYSDEKKTLIEMVASRHYTKSEKYLTITSSTLNPEVNKYMVFTARVSVVQPELNYMVVSRGGILLANTVRMTSRQKTFSVALSRDMVPQARMLVYCVLADGEVLADSLSFHVDGMKANDLPVVVNKGKDFSGKTLELTAHTYPGTFIAFSACDYSVYRRGGSRDKHANIFFTRNAVEEDLASYDPLGNHSFSHRWLLDENQREFVHYNAPSHGIDANMTFAFNGLNIFTDAYIARIPAIWSCNQTLGQEPCFSGGCYHTDQRCDGVRQCVDAADEMGCPDPQVIPPTKHEPEEEFMGLQRIWTYLEPSDWAWGHFYTKPHGNIEYKVKMPVRANTWLIGAFGLNPIHGLVFTHNPSRVETSKPFYIIVDVAPKATMGEQLGVRVVCFNYWDRRIEALLTLPASDQYDFVHVEEYGRTSSYAPRTSKSTIQTMVLLQPGTQRMIFFPVRPKKPGKVKVTIIAESPLNRYVVTKTISVRMNGVTNVYHTPYLINLVSQGSVIIPNLEIPVEERFYDPEDRRQIYVPGSAKARISLVGDVMGPGILPPYLRQGGVTEYFAGAGQSYVFDFAINLYWLQFLRQTNQLDPKIRASALGGMVTSLKSMMPYIGANHGMAARRSRTTESVWQTAFIVQTLAAGSDSEWEDTLYVHVDIINQLTWFILKHQDPTTGAFRWARKPLDLTFSNKLYDEKGVPRNISLTAYIAISLAKSVPALTGEVKSSADEAKDRAASYLAKYLDDITDPFQLCLVTYALYVTDSRAKGKAFELMRSIRRLDNYVYWSSVPIPMDPVELINTVPFQWPRPLPRIEDMQAIQATSYALLVYLLNNRFDEAEPIMIWLQQQRFSDSAYAGPQATIIALQALKEYGERLTHRDLYHLSVDLEATADPKWRRKIDMTNGNFLKFMTNAVNSKKAYGSIRARVRGTGMALLQMRTEVNVEYSDLMRSQMRGEDQRAFDLDIDKLLHYGRNGSHLLYRICVRWARPDIAPQSGASVLDIELPTGFWASKKHIVSVVKAGPLNKHRPISTWNKVIFFYDYITTTRQCHEFKAIRWLPVANATIQLRISLFDTFNPGFQNTTLYTVYTLFHNHICQVCASFQCPYCPFYNHSPRPASSSVSPSLLVTASLLALILYDFFS